MRCMVRRRARVFVRELGGEIPECLGYYLAGEVECDGSPLCAWKTACRIYRDYLRVMGIAVAVHRGITPVNAIKVLVLGLLRDQYPEGGTPKQARHEAAWGRFVEALKDALGIPIHASPDSAGPGELYARTRMHKGAPRERGIHVRAADGGRDALIVWYHTRISSRLEPDIRLTVDLRTLVETYPRARALASRWCEQKPTALYAQSTAIRVRPECIEDMARLFARALLDGHCTRARLKHGLFGVLR